MTRIHVLAVCVYTPNGPVAVQTQGPEGTVLCFSLRSYVSVTSQTHKNQDSMYKWSNTFNYFQDMWTNTAGIYYYGITTIITHRSCFSCAAKRLVKPLNAWQHSKNNTTNCHSVTNQHQQHALGYRQKKPEMQVLYLWQYNQDRENMVHDGCKYLKIMSE